MLIPLGFLGTGAPLASFELISTTVLSSSQSSVTLNLSAGQQAAYKHLQLRITDRTDRSPAVADVNIMRFNGDTASNYSFHFLRGNGSATGSLGSSATGYIQIGETSAINGGTGVYGGMIIDVLDAFNTSKNKTVRIANGIADPANSMTWMYMTSGAWYSTAATSSISFYSYYGANYVAGSRFSLYGVRG